MKHIMVADDRPEAVDALVRRLRHLGHKVTLVSEGNQVIQAAKAARPDLLILDIYFPPTGSVATATNDIMPFLRKDEDLKALPVVLMSAHEGAAVAAIDNANFEREEQFTISCPKANGPMAVINLVEKFFKTGSFFV